MKDRLLLALFFPGILLFVGNNFIIDWESLVYRRVNEELDQLLEVQRKELADWQKGENTPSEYRKRFYCEGELVKWSDNKPFPEIDSAGEVQVIDTEMGLFLVQHINEGRCLLASAFPLTYNYPITNQYLSNTKNKQLNRAIRGLSNVSGEYSYKGYFYFSLEAPPNRIINAGVGLLIIIAFFYWYIANSFGDWKRFLVISIVLTGLRWVGLYYEVLPALIRYPLFSELNYHSSSFNPNLGDLLINVVFILVLVRGILHYTSENRSSFFQFFLGLLTVTSLLQIHTLVRNILNNSQLTLDIGSSIGFPFLRLISFLILFIQGLTCLLLVERFIRTLNRAKSSLFGLLAVSIAVILCVVFEPYSIIVLSGGFVLIIGFLKFSFLFKREEEYNTVFLLLFCSVLSAQVAFTIYKHNERRDLTEKQKFANYLLLKRDILGESIINEALSSLDVDALISDRLILEEQLLSIFSSPYFKKYKISVVDKLDEDLSIGSTGFKDIAYINENEVSGYVSKIVLADSTEVNLVFELKRRVSTAVFPELLADERFINSSTKFDYAILRQGELLYQNNRYGKGEWLSQEELNKEELYRQGIELNEKHYFGINTLDGRTILIASDIYSKQNILSNFSFLILVLFSIYNLYYFLSQYSFRRKIGFSTKLQFYLSLSLIIPIIITGLALLSSLTNSYRDEINRSYSKKAIMVAEVMEHIDMSNGAFVQDRLYMMANMVQSDVSYYDLSGFVTYSSQPEIFSLGMESPHINPIVFTELLGRGNQTIVANESIGKLNFKVCYANVTDADENVVGFISLPFFNSRNHLERQKIEVFGNIMKVFSFIFILSILFGNLVIRRLLNPLRIVSEKISRISLQETNMPISYGASDEIGILVDGYNNMLVKLEESKEALAQTQKELAWKGIAKQVAHEIKNPLTPMRLKIQQLQSKYDSESKEYETLMILLKQVEILNQIATSFSAFADMPVPEKSVFDFSLLVRNTIHFNVNDRIKLTMEIEDDLYIEADSKIFRRILNNLVLNAIQSVKDGEVALTVRLAAMNDKVLLSIQDNGVGIPIELKEKIFVHYFSTKSSGSGIGLALAKKGIENAGGNIWFESEEGEGSIFYVSIPRAVSGQSVSNF